MVFVLLSVYRSRVMMGSLSCTGRRLVVGASGSPGSLSALRYARGLALRIEVPVVAVQAWVPPGGDLAERRCPAPGLRRVWAEAARQRLEDAVLAAWGGAPPGLDAKLVVCRGDPGPVLVDLADSVGDVLVVGAGRRAAVSRVWRGRVGRYCLAHAQCPVLAVPQPAGAREMGLRPATWALRHRELTMDRVLREWDAAWSGPGAARSE
jgi:nucleotide-binding universal stress UspA family protein